MRFKKEGFKMESKDYLAYLVEEIHTTVVATVDDAGLPVTAAIDMMDADEGDVYFLTARGKGFYDRFLRKLAPGCLKVGLAFESQKSLDLPVEGHDARLDMIVTEKCVYVRP